MVPRLCSNGGLLFDEGVPSGVFASPRADIIRTSLVNRLSHSAGALCLYGEATLDDDWVVWVLSTARELRLPLLGAPIGGAATNECGGRLIDLGVDLVPLNAARIAARFEEFTLRSPGRTSSPSELADTLRMMRHPLR